MTEQNTFLVDDNPYADPQSANTEQVSAPKPNTPLTSLKDALNKKVQKKPITLNIPAEDRAGVSMRFNTNLEESLLEAWRNASTRRGKGGRDDQVNMLGLASKVLFSLNEAILFRGQEELDDNGNPISLKSRELPGMLGAESTSPVGILQALYGYDAHIIIAMQEVLEACGYSADVDMAAEDDPTI